MDTSGTSCGTGVARPEPTAPTTVRILLATGSTPFRQPGRTRRTPPSPGPQVLSGCSAHVGKELLHLLDLSFLIGPTAIKPFLDLQPVMNMTQPMPYLEIQKLIENGNQPGFQNYWKADMYRELPDEAIDALASVTAEPPSTMTT